jgi:hypothetical protein
MTIMILPSLRRPFRFSKIEFISFLHLVTQAQRPIMQLRDSFG